MEKLTSFFIILYVYTKKIEDSFKIVFETNMVIDKNKIETLLFDERNNNDDHYWLILSHSNKKNMVFVMNVEKKILNLAIINVLMILL